MTHAASTLAAEGRLSAPGHGEDDALLRRRGRRRARPSGGCATSGFPGGIVAFLLLYYLPSGAGLSGAAQAGIACFALALVWWVTEPFPTYVTSLVADVPAAGDARRRRQGHHGRARAWR